MSGETPKEDLNRQFMRLYTLVQPRLYGYLISMIPNWGDVEDVLQETAVVLWNKFESFEPGTDFGAWALAIARFQVLSYYKKIKSRRIHFSDQALELLNDEALASGKRENDRVDYLKECLGRLQEKDRLLLEMRYELGSDVKEIALQLQQNLYTLYKTLNRIHILLFHCVQRKMSME